MESFSVHLDPASLHASTSGAITGRLHVKVGNRAFPEVEWSDFPVIVLGWWCNAVGLVASHAVTSVNLRFMDGPLGMTLSEPGEVGEARLTLWRDPPRMQPVEALVSIRIVQREMLAASRVALEYCVQQSVESADTQTLRQAMLRLQQAAQ